MPGKHMAEGSRSELSACRWPRCSARPACSLLRLRRRPAQALKCGGKKVTIKGTAGDDKIVGKGASDVIDGRGGDDVDRRRLERGTT